jgi:hypothetical protein
MYFLLAAEIFITLIGGNSIDSIQYTKEAFHNKFMNINMFLIMAKEINNIFR